MWNGTITRSQAIKMFDQATDKDDPNWEYLTEDFYDETMDAERSKEMESDGYSLYVTK